MPPWRARRCRRASERAQVHAGCLAVSNCASSGRKGRQENGMSELGGGLWGCGAPTGNATSDDGWATPVRCTGMHLRSFAINNIAITACSSSARACFFLDFSLLQRKGPTPLQEPALATARGFKDGGSVVVGRQADQYAQHVPEHQRDRCKQVQRSSRRAVGGVVVDDARSVVQHAGAGKQHHYPPEPHTHLEARSEERRVG